jgi:hypothetical protein
VPHLRGPAPNPGQCSDLSRRCRHRRWGVWPKVRFKHGAMVDEWTLRTIMLAALPLCDPPRAVRVEGALDTGLGHATEPGDVARGHPLTAPVEGCHPHWHPRVRGMKAPIPQRV